MSNLRHIKVNLSNTFSLKSRCKYCGSTPEWYYYTRTSQAFEDNKVFQFISEWIKSNYKRMCQDYYLIEYPRSYNRIGNFAHLVDYKAYNPNFHKNCKYHNKSNDTDLYTVDHLSCHCGKTNWAFSTTASKNKLEIKQRKARVYILKSSY